MRSRAEEIKKNILCSNVPPQSPCAIPREYDIYT